MQPLPGSKRLRSLIRQRPRLTATIALAGVALLSLAAWLVWSMPRTVTVVRTASGFSPKIVTIRAGDTVRFISDAGAPFWPASDSHPSHTLYSAFDPKKAVAPDQEWSFTFAGVGVWRYHDHMSSNVTGLVVVENSFGQGTQECLKRRVGDSPAPYCWAAEITDLVKEKGIRAAFVRVDELYTDSADFRRNCHDVMHILGSASYQRFSNDSSILALPETSYCGYGFYHGFMEAMVAANGPEQFSDARRYCEQVEVAAGKSASGPCFHGIGHALLDSQDGKYWGSASGMTAHALGECEQALEGSFQEEQCSSGVFNSLSNAMSARMYDLSFAGFDPGTFCMAQPALYQVACVREAGIGYIRNNNLEPEEAQAYIRTMPVSNPVYRTDLYFVYFGDELKRGFDSFSPDAWAKECDSYTDVRQGACIAGVLEGIREEVGMSTMAKTLFSFCAAFPQGGSRTRCIQDSVTHHSPAFPDAKEFTRLCRETAGTDADRLCIK